MIRPPPLRIGATVIGGGGELLGHVGAVYVDNATGVPAWAAVQGRHHTAVVPLQHSRFDGTTLQVPYDAARLQGAPHHDPATLISYAEGDDLARHYGLLPGAPTPHLRLSPPQSTGVGDGVMVRSEERLRTDTVNVVVGRARLVVTVVTEDQTFTVPVRRQEVRLVYDPVPEHEQTLSSAGPAEETVEVVLHAEQVLITTQVVPVERARMVKRVVTAGQTVTAQVRSEQIDLDHLDRHHGDHPQNTEQSDMPRHRAGDNHQETP